MHTLLLGPVSIPYNRDPTTEGTILGSPIYGCKALLMQQQESCFATLSATVQYGSSIKCEIRIVPYQGTYL